MENVSLRIVPDEYYVFSSDGHRRCPCIRGLSLLLLSLLLITVIVIVIVIVIIVIITIV